MSDLPQKPHSIWAWFIGLPIGLVCLMIAAWLAYGLYRTHMATVEREKAVAREAEDTARWMREREREEQLAKLSVQEQGRKIKEDIARMKQEQEKERQRQLREEQAAAKDATAKAEVQPFVGRWQISRDDKTGERPFVVTLSKSFEAHKTNGPGVKGKWELIGDEVRITWSDGWSNILRQRDGRAIIMGFKPGTDWNDSPFNTLSATKSR
jgi:hypothetical protein